MLGRICKICKQDKPLQEFYKNKNGRDGYMGCCKACWKDHVKKNRENKKNYYRQYDKDRQRKNIKRILSHRYQGIKQRCEGNAVRHYHVEGMRYLSREEWAKWCEQNMDRFMSIYKVWASMDFPRKLCPSIDRINNKKGYTMDNIRWTTVAENSKKYTKQIIPFD